MRVTSLRLQNFRSFVDSGTIALAQITVLIGANNAGKSSVLRGLHLLQQGLPDPYPDVRVGATQAIVKISLIEGQSALNWITDGSSDKFTFTAQVQSSDRRTGDMQFTINQDNKNSQGIHRLPPTEPHHFIVPYLSKRKATGYQEDIREQYVISVESDVSMLAAKLSRLGNPAYPFHSIYYTACQSILGFPVAAIPSANGQRPGVYLPDGQTIPIDQLGEGVPNIVHFLVSLAVSEGKLFLVEEPENDLHPQALKALLDLILVSSLKNQFVVSTHSNIVVRHLCVSPNSILHQIRAKNEFLPVESEINQVPNTPNARLAVLSELGYCFSDLELWDGWFILEESSAERLIRSYLIPWFIPSLSRLRTVAAGGASKVNALFEDLNRLFLFTHLTPVYRERSWVVVDDDNVGREVIDKLKAKFPEDYHSRFRLFGHHAFEKYYPCAFAGRVDAVLAYTDPARRREAKRELLCELVYWLDEDPERGRIALEQSAAGVLVLLREIAISMRAAK